MVSNILFKDRVTKPQKKMLITLLRETKFMEGKKEKEWYWEKIQAALNTIGPKKTIIQWKKCWRDMRLTTRKKLAELKRCQLSGGSPPPGIELNQEDNDIIDIVGTEYFYEEMNGELKPENFLPGFDYVPEHFCDAILTAAAGQNHNLSTQKDQHQSHVHQTQQEGQTNDTDTNDAAISSNNSTFHGASVGQILSHNGEHSASTQNQSHGVLPQHPAFHGSLYPHIYKRQNGPVHRDLPFEERLLQFMQEAFPKRMKKRKQRDPDKMFLLSLYEEMKRVPEEIRLDVKAELIEILKKYQKKPKSPDKTSNTLGISKQSGITSSPQVPHMFQPLKKNEGSEKEVSPQSQPERARTSTGSNHPPPHVPHQIFQMQKKYEGSAEKVHQQNDQRKHAETAHAQLNSQAPPNEQHLHHTHLAQGIMFPITHIRNDPPSVTQLHTHSHHQQAQQQLSHQQPQQHHTAIFGSNGPTMNAERTPMPYESVG